MKNRMIATIASANRIGWMMTPPAMAMMSRMIPRIRSMPRRYPRMDARTPGMQPALTFADTASKVGAREGVRRRGRHRGEVGDRVRQEQWPRVVRAAERPELHDRTGHARHLLDEDAQRVAVERLERQQPRRGVRDRLQRPRVQRVADRAEQAAEQPRTED